jgi:hypothetical protein
MLQESSELRLVLVSPAAAPGTPGWLPTFPATAPGGPGCVPSFPAATLGLLGCVLILPGASEHLLLLGISSFQHFWCEDYVYM